MKALILAFFLIPAAYADASSVTDLYDESAHAPLNSNAALSGSMFTNDTELLTPRGIIDTPAPLTLTHELIPQATPENTVSSTTPGL